MYRTLLKKEWRAQWRSARLLILIAVLLISGLISPLLAKYTPELLRSIPDLPPGVADMIPEPGISDAIGQYLKNASQFGVLLVVILNMGLVAQEKERGTALLVLTHPVSRSALVLSKWLVALLSVALGVLAGALGSLFYSAILFEPLPLVAFTGLNLLLLVFLGTYLSIALLASSLAHSQSAAAGGAFAGLALLLILSSLPRVNEYMPAALLDWGSGLVLGEAQSAWWALAIALAIMLLSVLLACLGFERQELK